ncbi:MAG: hypothetical protein ABJC04_10390 [Verrucomicrobiota bacterium]
MKMKKSSCRTEELERLQRRYEGRGKEGKTQMLDEFCRRRIKDWRGAGS